jgi:predicted nucleic acid-binding protein
VPAECAWVVVDTNIALDLLVFDDPSARPFAAQLESGLLRWIATQAMRDELERVLCYQPIAARLQARELHAGGVLECFDRCAALVDAAGKAAWTCRDPDDQKFIDLAVAHRCVLLSKDAAVLSMKKRLAAAGVTVAAMLPGG